MHSRVSKTVHTPLGTAAYEKRGAAVNIPVWDPAKCIQCNQCSYVCPHATIRPFLLTAEEAANAPEGFKMADAKGGAAFEGYKFAMQVSSLDCLGCGSCVTVCPAKEKAITMVPSCNTGSRSCKLGNMQCHFHLRRTLWTKLTVKGSQFEQPLLEFSGACAGCGETPYAKLITQLFGDRMYVANATGCSSIWGGISSYITLHNKR